MNIRKKLPVLMLLRFPQEPVTPSPFRVGQEYQTLEGQCVRFVRVFNEGTRYETMQDHQGCHRYTRRDYGRVTGTSHKVPYRGNVPIPLV